MRRAAQALRAALPQLQARARLLGYLQTAASTASGLGVVAGTGWLATRSGLTASLLQIFSGASILDRVGGSVPFIGPLLAVLMGVGGNFGFLAVSLLVQSYVDACFAGAHAEDASPGRSPRASRRGALAALDAPGMPWQLGTRWLRANAAMGLALSPLYVAPAGSCTAGLLAGIAVGVGYVNRTIQRARTEATAPSFAHALFGLSVGLALAPIGAQAISGVAGRNILRQAVNFPLLALGCNAIVAAGRQLYSLFGATDTVRPGAEPVDLGEAVLYDGRNVATANVIVPLDVAQAVGDIVRHNQANIARGINEGARCLLLRAPHGSGKRQVAKAMARALGTRMYVLERSRFAYLGREHAGQVLVDQFRRWQQEAAQLGRPLVLYVPELLTLAPNVADVTQTQRRGDAAHLRAPATAAPSAPVGDEFVSQLKTLMANEGGGSKSNLLFVLATCAPRETMRARVDGAVQNRITRTLRWREPDAGELALLWTSHVNRALRQSVLHPACYASLLADGALARLLRHSTCAPLRLRQAEVAAMTGSEVAARVTQAVDATVQQYLRRRPPDLQPDEPDFAFAIGHHLAVNLDRALDRWLDGARGDAAVATSSDEGSPNLTDDGTDDGTIAECGHHDEGDDGSANGAHLLPGGGSGEAYALQPSPTSRRGATPYPRAI